MSKLVKTKKQQKNPTTVHVQEFSKQSLETIFINVLAMSCVNCEEFQPNFKLVKSSSTNLSIIHPLLKNLLENKVSQANAFVLLHT